MDPRLREAVDATLGWYGEIFRLHGIPTLLHEGVWSADAPPPPLHSAAIAAVPGVPAERIRARITQPPTAGFADPFADVDGASIGMRVLFEATWIHRPAGRGTGTGDPTAWHEVRTTAQLERWNGAWDTTDVLLPGLLGREHLLILERRDGSTATAGAVLRHDAGVIGVSNVHGLDGERVEWSELAAVARMRFGDRPIVGYERGDGLGAALDGGWDAIGPTRVWVPELEA